MTIYVLHLHYRFSVLAYTIDDYNRSVLHATLIKFLKQIRT